MRYSIFILSLCILLISCRKSQELNGVVKIDSGSQDPLNGILNIDDSLMIACGGKIYAHSSVSRSTNGGKSWTNTTNTDYDSKTIYGISRFGDRIYLCGEDGIILHSNDQGLTWIGYRSYLWPEYREIEYFHVDTGWAVGSTSDYGYLSKMNNYGEAYFSHRFHTSMYSMARLDDRHMVVGGSGIIVYSTDGGDSFLPSDADGDIFIRIINTPSGIYAFGVWGSVWRSDDLGEHWTELQKPRNGKSNSVIIRDAALLNDGAMACVGDKGIIRVSRDGWSTFENFDIGYRDYNFLSILQKTNNEILISGSDGLLLSNISL